MVEVESIDKLMKKCEDEIDKPWIRNKLKFFWHGSRGMFNEIRGVLCFDTPKLNKAGITAFKEICDGRIDKLQRLIAAHTTFIGISFATLTIAFSVINDAKLIPINDTKDTPLASFPGLQWFIWGNGWWGMRILLFLILVFVIIFAISVFRSRAQAYAWYAVREGVLLTEGKEDETEA